MSVFFTSRKTGFKSWLDTSSTLCYLSSFFICFLSLSLLLLDTWWIDREGSCLLDNFSTSGGTIKLLFLDLMSYSSIPQLSTTFSLIPPSIASSIPLDTCIYRALLRTYIFILRNPILIFSISLNLSVPVHLLNTFFLTLNLFLCDFSNFFKIFLLLVSF